MVFTEIDRHTMRMLCTLVQLSKNTGANREDVIKVGQHLGVPKDDTIELFEEIEESDVMHLSSEEEKLWFVQSCFSYMERGRGLPRSEVKFYDQVIKELGLNIRSNN